MTLQLPAIPTLAARTVAVDAPDDLLALVPPGGMAWVRRGEGMIAWGEVARFDSRGSSRIDDAATWWRRLTRHAVVRDDARLPGSGLVAFGSFSFADGSSHGGTLIVPRFVLGMREGRGFLTEITTDGKHGAHPSVREALGASSPAPSLPPLTQAEGDRGAWDDAVRSAVARIGQGEVDKVVLARAVAATGDSAVDPRSLMPMLARDYDGCWTFHVDGLVGASPELLARVDHGLVTSRVLAGTIRRTGDETADLARAASLAHSSKDREEHGYAVRSVTQVLASHCASVNVPDEPFVLHLPNVMHLATDITGSLDHAATVLEMVRELHPSAAVCGTPTLAAARMIDELEGWDRGRYAGPVGWIDAAGDGEFCIGLRSAEINPGDPRKVRMFAGCGIVAASEPESEWAESEAKLEPMRQALGLA